jgi:NADH:ubiquinone oxidoreductase subunit
MNLGTRLWVWWYGEPVGSDQYGNKYYRQKNWRLTEKGAGKFSRERRWVIYADETEASRVPAEWHGWLHHTAMDPPTAEEMQPRYPWQKPHEPNLTGTPQAYRPRGSLLRGGVRAPATGDYEAWKPE